MIFLHIDSNNCIYAKCSFWDYNYEWVGNIHDWAFVQKIDVKICVMKGKFLPYKLIRNVVYPM
jgi:hypothetical protein